MPPSSVPPPFEQVEVSARISKGTYFFDAGIHDPEEKVELEAVYGGMEDCAPDFVVERNGFSPTALELVVGGEGEVELDGQRHELGPGAVFSYGIGTPVRIRTEPDFVLKKYFVCMRGETLTAALAAARLEPGRLRWVADPFEIQRAWDQLISEGRSLRPGRSAICAAQLRLLLVKLTHMPDAGPAARSAGGGAEVTFRRCRDYVDEQAAHIGSITEIMTATGVARAHLSRLFRRFQGESPYQYLIRRKMSLAAEHLAAGDCLVKEAARSVGMADPYHFSRLFKGVYRMAPSEFARRMGRRGD